MTAHVLLNPAARGGRNRTLRRPLERALAAAGVDAEIVETAAETGAEGLAREIGTDGGLVIVAGGDGTVHQAVNGLAGTDGTLAVLPVGTGNDYAHALGMPDGLDAAARALVTAPRRWLDVGQVAWTDGDGARHTRAFANCLGIGFDAHAAALAAETKWLGGRASYLAAVLRTLWTWRRPALHVQVRSGALAGAIGGGMAGGARDDPAPSLGSALDYDGPLFLCEVGNGHSVGGGFLITPDARPDDGLLDVCLVPHLTPGRALQLLPQTFTGSHVGAPEVTLRRTTELSLAVVASAPEAWTGVGLQADGETLTYDAVEVTVTVQPGVLAVLAPRVGPGGRSSR